MPRIISIDGNIGGGKTTTLEYIRDTFELEVDLEPVESWQPWLDKMYVGGCGVFEFQVKVWIDRCWPSTSACASKSRFIERSPFFQLGVFVPANVSSGKLSDDQHALINELYEKTLSAWEPDTYIYLRSNPANCAERIMRRGRKSEENIPMRYLTDLHDLHETSFQRLVASGKNACVIDVEGKTIKEIAEEVMRLID